MNENSLVVCVEQEALSKELSSETRALSKELSPETSPVKRAKSRKKFNGGSSFLSESSSGTFDYIILLT